MKAELDYILTFTEKEWKSFPEELQQVLFENYGEFVNKFTIYTDCEEENSIKIAQNYFFCVLEQSGMWDFFEEWLKENDYNLDYVYWQHPLLGVLIDD